MQKSSLVALIMGTVSGVLFALGMCMSLLPEWNAFKEGILFSTIGMILGIITLLVWCKMENKKLPKMSGKNIFTYHLCYPCRFGSRCRYVYVSCVGADRMGYAYRLTRHHYADCFDTHD